jgi:poly(A) polymerase
MKEYLDREIFRTLSLLIDAEGIEAFVIGGFVRDCLLGRDAPKDIDIVVAGSGIALAKKLAARLGHGAKVNYYKKFGTAMVRTDGLDIEFVGARKESYSRDSRKPVVEDGTIEDDQRRRDFTINALAIGLNNRNFGNLVDPFNGLIDLNLKLLRTPQDPDTTFSDDPLRMMRAIRFASELGFIIEEETFKAIVRNRERIGIVSAERITDELHKILQAPVPSEGLSLLDTSGLLPLIFPELAELKGVEELGSIRHKDNFYHTITVVDNISRKTDNLWLRWTALLHDIAKPATKRFSDGNGWTFHGHEYVGAGMIPVIFRKHKLPLNDKMKYVQKLVLLHLRPIALSQDDVTDSAVRRLIFDAGDDLEDLMTLCEADITSRNEYTVRKHLANFNLVREKISELEERDHIRNFQPPISGEMIMQAFGIGPSKPVGEIKNAIKEAILDGDIRNDYHEAYELMIRKGKEMGLEPAADRHVKD